VAQSRAERAAKLFGAAESLRLALGVTNPPNIQAEIDSRLQTVRTALGETAYSFAYMVGRSLPLDAAVEYALKDALPA
jgi:hypothetical protein